MRYEPPRRPDPAFVALLGGLLALLVLPVVLAPEVGPLDLANHAGRVQILANLGRVPALQALYGIRPWPTPNLAADLLMTPLVYALGMDPGVRVFTGLALCAFALSFVLLRRVCVGRLDGLALLGVPLAVNLPFNYGFINYYVGVAAALASYALWLRQAARAPGGETWLRGALRALLVTACGLLTYLMHLVGFGTLVSATLVSIVALWGRGRLRGRALAGQLALWLLLVVPGAAMYVTFSRGAVGGAALHRLVVWSAPRDKLLGLLRVLRAGPLGSDALLYALLAVLVLGAARLWLSGRRRAAELAARPQSEPALLAGLSLCALSVVMPSALDLETWGIDLRVALPAQLLVLAAGLRLPERASAGRRGAPAAQPGAGRVLFGLLLLLSICGATALRSAALLGNWREAALGIAESRSLCERLPDGARVLTLHNAESAPAGRTRPPGRSEYLDGERNGWAYCLAGPHGQRRAARPLFFPALFHVPGSQPLLLRLPTYEETDTLAHYHIKNGFADPTQVGAIPWDAFQTLGDYLWLSGWDLGALRPLQPACFTEVARTPRVALYRIGCPKESSPSPSPEPADAESAAAPSGNGE